MQLAERFEIGKIDNRLVERIHENVEIYKTLTTSGRRRHEQTTAKKQ